VDAFLRDLRGHIYGSRSGRCLDARQWKSFYAEGRAADCATWSHLSSCPDCLGVVNEILGLPALEERHPIGSLGKETRDKGGRGGGPTGGAGGGSYEARRCRQRARVLPSARWPATARPASTASSISNRRAEAFAPTFDGKQPSAADASPSAADPSLGFVSTQTLGQSLGAGGVIGGLLPMYQLGGARSVQIGLKLHF